MARIFLERRDMGDDLRRLYAGLEMACFPDGEAAFHLAERTFGRFARATQLNGAFDAGKAEATLVAGGLRITLPRLEERRGREIRIPIRTA